ncbi:MAG: DUF447 family protein [Candidatus Methanoperedens sp.]|nr:DUF447 family protein [Candidatus Methanoperedens sp.]
MINLEEFGIQEGISEVIFTSMSIEGIPNAAPIGLHMKNGKLFARIYKSNTLDNIIENSKAAANIVDDPALFVQSALSDIGPERFDFVEGFPVLKGSLGWIIFDCRVRKGENISVVELQAVKSKILTRKIKPVNRGSNAVIEATVHATRYIVLKEQKYLDHIDHYNTIVQKCGGPGEKEAMKLLYDLIRL